MTKGRLVNTIYAACGKNLSRKACENVVDVVTSDVVRGLVTTGTFRLPGVGTFKVKERKERLGYNIGSRQIETIAARKTVTFKPADGLKALVNNPNLQ